MSVDVILHILSGTESKLNNFFQDRRKVYAILEGEGIEIPRYAVLDRDSPDPKRK